MLVYVDDFKMVAQKGDHDALWKELKEVIDMGEEEEEHRFLGCHYSSSLLYSWSGRGPVETAPIIPPEASPNQRGLQR